MMQRREGESPEEHIARITALINKAAEAMAVALMERKRRMEARRYSGTIRMEKEDGNVHYYLSSSRVPPLYSDYCWLPCYNILT